MSNVLPNTPDSIMETTSSSDHPKIVSLELVIKLAARRFSFNLQTAGSMSCANAIQAGKTSVADIRKL